MCKCCKEKTFRLFDSKNDLQTYRLLNFKFMIQFSLENILTVLLYLIAIMPWLDCDHVANAFDII